MKIIFDSPSNYIQFEKSPKDKIFISLSTKDPKNALSSIVNTVEITPEELHKLVQSVSDAKNKE